MQNFASWTQLWGRRSAVPAASPSAPARSATVFERSAKTGERLDGAAQRVRDDRPPETRLEALRADERNETAGNRACHRRPFGTCDYHFEPLSFWPAHRDDQATARYELLVERSRHVGRRSSDHDRVKGGELGQAERAVAHVYVHGAEASPFEPLARLLRELRDPLDGVHVGSQLRENRSLIARAGPDVEDAVALPDEGLAWNARHRVENTSIGDSTRLELLDDHPVSLAVEVRHCCERARAWKREPRRRNARARGARDRSRSDPPARAIPRRSLPPRSGSSSRRPGASRDCRRRRGGDARGLRTPSRPPLRR